MIDVQERPSAPAGTVVSEPRPRSPEVADTESVHEDPSGYLAEVIEEAEHIAPPRRSVIEEQARRAREFLYNLD